MFIERKLQVKLLLKFQLKLCEIYSKISWNFTWSFRGFFAILKFLVCNILTFFEIFDLTICNSNVLGFPQIALNCKNHSNNISLFVNNAMKVFRKSLSLGIIVLYTLKWFWKTSRNSLIKVMLVRMLLQN